jgi:hypothetical protein
MLKIKPKVIAGHVAGTGAMLIVIRLAMAAGYSIGDKLKENT